MTQFSFAEGYRKEFLSADAVGVLLGTIILIFESFWLGLLGWLMWKVIDWLF
jgi:hypothetical protein